VTCTYVANGREQRVSAFPLPHGLRPTAGKSWNSNNVSLRGQSKAKREQPLLAEFGLNLLFPKFCFTAHWISDFIFAPSKLMNGVDGIRGSAQY
jgi:hypothetical protein